MTPSRCSGACSLDGLSALATLPLYLPASFGWMDGLLGLVTRTDEGYVRFSLARYTICLVIMLPSTFCEGIIAPADHAILLTLRGDGERAIAAYGLNTLGSIVGAADRRPRGCSRCALDARMLVLGASLDMALGVALLYVATSKGDCIRRGARRGCWASATVAASLLALVASDFDPRVSAAVRSKGRHDRRDDLRAQHALYEDSTATVSWSSRRPTWRLRSSRRIRKPDASLPAVWFEGAPKLTVLNPPWPPTLPLPSARADGHAGAASRRAAPGRRHQLRLRKVDTLQLASPSLEVVETIEIEPAITRGARALYPANAAAYDDPRSKIITADAKTHFSSLVDVRDLIFSEPSNPWVSGVSNLFTREFYGHVRRSLSERGIYAQWLHLYEIDDDSRHQRGWRRSTRSSAGVRGLPDGGPTCSSWRWPSSSRRFDWMVSGALMAEHLSPPADQHRHDGRTRVTQPRGARASARAH